ncbi:hypothetical protein BOC52_25335 [Burkholderia pseudomallei]|nr:hypothetical protein BOC36_09260 [Burkholderia pseudomallei]ARK64305.1 hypothetical protein BOC37_32510 [Burkholderia pseudomallei]ARK76731.1 hypothetical protein BOC39_24985 [Burkholderia pseudomallei]ARL59775.1 hypothetical protein BOC52_25335 [Burkholderia pseudomallei]ARL66195.1 hypothetical protein BOC53_22420 [Burkholderia pseudomallei]
MTAVMLHRRTAWRRAVALDRALLHLIACDFHVLWAGERYAPRCAIPCARLAAVRRSPAVRRSRMPMPMREHAAYGAAP